jgi:peptidoglycan/xylan/chitin deacetylase (PgdA/CDA1 family)
MVSCVQVRRESVLRVLAYHRVAEFRSNAAVDDRGISATPSGFREQMRHIARYYRCVSMGEVLDAMERKARLPKRSVLITFDDGYCDFAENAWPILQKFRMTATMFVPTAFPDHPERIFWWDKLYQAFTSTASLRLRETPLGPIGLATVEERERGLRALQNYFTTIGHQEGVRLVEHVCTELGETAISGGSVLSWNQLRQLAKDGVTIGSHTRNHPIITRLSPDQIREEIRGSQEDLKREIGVALPIFCYPNGNHDDGAAAILKDEGVRLAFTTIPSRNELDATDPLRLGRTCITPRTSLAIFGARLQQLGMQLDAWRHRKLKETLTRTVPQNQYA